jgi:hypothetical protein
MVANTSLGLGRRVLPRGDRALDPSDVVPSAVLPADTPVGFDGLEPHGAVQAGARVVRQRHARDGGAETAFGQTIKQCTVKRATTTSSPQASLKVDADRADSPRRRR